MRNSEKALSVGNNVQFFYNGKLRHVKIESVRVAYPFLGLVGPVVCRFTGWDACADAPTGGYRQFNVDKIDSTILVVG